MAYKKTSGVSEDTRGRKPDSLRGDGARHSDMQDRRAGAYDRVTKKPAQPMKEHTTPHQASQWGADVRPVTEPSDEGEPEGLRRPRMSAVNPTTGRGGVPSHVPGGKAKT